MASVWDQYRAQSRRTSDGSSTGALNKWIASPPSGPSKVLTGSPAADTDPGAQRLKEQTTKADNLNAMYEAAGEEAPGGETSLIDGVLNVLGRGRAAVTGGVSGSLNMVGTTLEGLGVSNVLDEWTAETWNGKEGQDATPDGLGDALANTPWGRALRGLAGREKYGAGDFNGPLKTYDDDSTVERWAKLGGAFVTDVGLDPVTYMTFGAGAVGKQAATAGLKGAAALAARDLTDDAVKAVAGRDAVYKSLRTAVEKGDSDNVFGELAKYTGRTVEELKDEYGTAGAALGANARRFATDQLENEMATGYLSRGGRGLREAINSNDALTDAQKKAVWAQLTPELRGGVRLTVPFTGKSTAAALAGGVDNSLLDQFKLGRAADAIYGLRGTVSTSKPMTAVRGKLGGQTGAAYSDVLKDAYDSALEGGPAARFTDWRNLRDIMGKNRGAEASLSRESLRTMDAIAEPLRNLSDDQRESAKAALTAYTHDASKAAPDATADAGTQAGYAAALALREAMAAKHAQYREAGGDIGEITDYMARLITPEAREAMAKKSRARAAGSADPAKAREAYSEVIGVDDNGDLAFKWTEIPRINEAHRAKHGYDLFEEDPLQILSMYMAAMDSRIASADLVRALQRAGLVVDAGKTTVKTLDGKRLNDVVKDARASAGRTGTSTKALDDVLQGNVAEFLTRTATWPYEERQRAVDALMVAARDVLRTERDNVAQGTTAPAKTTKQLAKLAKSLSRATVASVYKEQQTASALSESLADNGFEVLGSARANGRAKPLTTPQGIGEDTYVNRVARDVLEAHYAARTPDSLAQDMYDAVTPYMRVFVAWATVGRGGGYHVRNGIGAWWNNTLQGVTRRNYKNSAKIMLARKEAAAAARALPDDADANTIQTTIDDVMRTQLQPELYSAWRTMDDLGLYTSTMRSQLLQQDMPGDIGLSYLDEANAIKQPRVLKNLRFEKYTPVDVTPNKAPGDKTRLDRALNRTVNNAWIQFSGDIGQITEEYFRTAAFLKGVDTFGLQDGGSSAYTLVRASQFDYGDLSDVERKYMKFIFPFWVWTRNNVPLQVRALVADPKYASTLGKFQDGLASMFGDDSPEGQAAEDNMPDWLKSRQAFVTGLNFGGGPITWGVESPVTDLNKLGAWSLDPADWWKKLSTEGVGMASPLIKMPVEAATGVDTFTGSAIPDTVDAPNWALPAQYVPGLNRFLASNVAGEERPQMNGVLANFIKDSAPPVGMIENLIPFGQPDRNSDRWLTSLASTAAGAPASTLTKDQMAFSLMEDNNQAEAELKKLLGSKYPTVPWEQFRDLVRGGASPEYMQQWLAQYQ